MNFARATLSLGRRKGLRLVDSCFWGFGLFKESFKELVGCSSGAYLIAWSPQARCVKDLPEARFIPF